MDSDSPPSLQSQESQVSRSPIMAAVSQAIAQVCGTTIALYATKKASLLLTSDCKDNRWQWGCGVIAVIAVPVLLKYIPEATKAILRRW